MLLSNAGDDLPAVNALKNRNADGALSRPTWITAEMIFSSPYISFNPRKPLSTPRLHFFAFLVISLRLYRCFRHLDCVFLNRFSSLYPASKRSSTRSPYVRSSFRFQKDIVFRSVRLDIFVLNVVDQVRVRYCLCDHPLTPCVFGVRYRTLLCISPCFAISLSYSIPVNHQIHAL